MYSPIVKQTTIHVILALEVNYQWPLHQLDVTNAFLHGMHQEDVYMVQPQRFVDPYFPNHICKLHKSLYGLKQAPRVWVEHFSNYLLVWDLTGPILTIPSSLNTIRIPLLLSCYMWMTWSLQGMIQFTFSNSSLNWVSCSKWRIWGRFFIFWESKLVEDRLDCFCPNQNMLRISSWTSMIDCKAYGSPSNYKGTTSSDISTVMVDPKLYRSIMGALQYPTLLRPATYAWPFCCWFPCLKMVMLCLRNLILWNSFQERTYSAHCLFRHGLGRWSQWQAFYYRILCIPCTNTSVLVCKEAKNCSSLFNRSRV